MILFFLSLDSSRSISLLLFLPLSLSLLLLVRRSLLSFILSFSPLSHPLPPFIVRQIKFLPKFTCYQNIKLHLFLTILSYIPYYCTPFLPRPGLEFLLSSVIIDRFSDHPSQDLSTWSVVSLTLLHKGLVFPNIQYQAVSSPSLSTEVSRGWLQPS